MFHPPCSQDWPGHQEYEAYEAVGDGRKAAQSRDLKAIAYMHLPVPQKKALAERDGIGKCDCTSVIIDAMQPLGPCGLLVVLPQKKAMFK